MQARYYCETYCADSEFHKIVAVFENEYQQVKAADFPDIARFIEMTHEKITLEGVIDFFVGFFDPVLFIRVISIKS